MGGTGAGTAATDGAVYIKYPNYWDFAVVSGSLTSNTNTVGGYKYTLFSAGNGTITFL